MLVTVLIFTAVGLLIGAGTLLLFRFQCQMRIDRQHELEKVYAVRSALNYIMACDGNIKESGKSFGYHTGSERNLGLLVKPVKAIFPDLNNAKHFAMQQKENPFTVSVDQYNINRDYEYGSTTNLMDKSIYGKCSSGYGLVFGDLEATSNAKWWVNIGMRDTGGWLQEDYGRRYYFQALEFLEVNAGGTNDIMRLCIIRNVTNTTEGVGRKYGWPLSQKNERALVFEISPSQLDNNNNTNNAEMVCYEWVHNGVAIKKDERIRWQNRPSRGYMGLQVADDKISIFYIGNATVNTIPDGGGYSFSPSVSLTPDTYNYFSRPVEIGGITYPGVITNLEGKVQAPELRAVFEVEAVANDRKGGVHNVDFLTNFKVTPAYQYDVFLEHPAFVTNRATVAQKIGTYNRSSGQYFTVLTYDTHGTDHKGFRQDEREYRSNGN